MEGGLAVSSRTGKPVRLMGGRVRGGIWLRGSQTAGKVAVGILDHSRHTKMQGKRCGKAGKSMSDMTGPDMTGPLSCLRTPLSLLFNMSTVITRLITYRWHFLTLCARLWRVAQITVAFARCCYDFSTNVTVNEIAVHFSNAISIFNFHPSQSTVFCMSFSSRV